MGTSPATVSTASILSQVDVTETVADAPAAIGQTLRSNAFNQGQRQLNATSTPPVTKYSGETWTLDGSGDATIDLTDLPGTQANVDGTGLKVNVFRVICPTGNSGAVTITPGASNPYNLAGASFSITVEPGDEWLYVGYDTSPDVTDVSGSGNQTIDLAGTAADTCNIDIGLG